MRPSLQQSAAPDEWLQRRHASRSGHMPHRVVALTASGVAPFELGCVVEVFGLERPELDVPWWYGLRVAAETPGPLPATAGGFAFVVEHGLEALCDADTIVMPGWHGEPSAAVVAAVRAA